MTAPTNDPTVKESVTDHPANEHTPEALDAVAAIRERLAAASPGPWKVRPLPYDDWGWVRGPDDNALVACARAGKDFSASEHRQNGTDPYAHNAALIANAPSDLAFLLADNEALRAQLATATKNASSWEFKHGTAEREVVRLRSDVERACKDADRTRAACETVTEKLKESEAQLAAARADGERLDALQAIVVRSDGVEFERCGLVVTMAEMRDDGATHHAVWSGGNVRAAIDAARAPGEE